MKCGAFEVLLPNLEGPHRALARAIVGQKARLAGSEIRFLREVLGWSGANFAEHMGTPAKRVSRWELARLRLVHKQIGYYGPFTAGHF